MSFDNNLAISIGDLLLGFDKTIATLVEISELNFAGGISTLIEFKFSGKFIIPFLFAVLIILIILSRYNLKIFIYLIYIN